MPNPQHNSLLKPTRNLFIILSKFNSIPAFKSDALSADLQLAAMAIKENEQAFTSDIEVYGVSCDLKEKIKSIAYNKGITISQMLRPSIVKLSQTQLPVANKKPMKIKGVPAVVKTKLEVTLKIGGKSMAEVMIQEMERIVRETPEHMHVKRM